MGDGRPSRPPPPPRIFISAAELSGDRHAAALIHAIRQLRPDATFWGLAGPLMQAAGCTPIDDWTRQSAMLVSAVRLAGRAWQLLRRIRRRLDESPADLAVLVDSPALHLPMAKPIRAAGVPVLYYIAPQLWAWAPWRIRRVRKRVNRMAAILPFEEQYFRSRGVDTRYVGHPLIEQLQHTPPDPAIVSRYQQAGRPVIACLPGSRRHVIAEVLPGQIQVARAIARRYPQATFLFSAADSSAAAIIRSALVDEPFPLEHFTNACESKSRGLQPARPLEKENVIHTQTLAAISIETARNPEILAAADLALVASGTATLEAAWHRLPMVVMYNGSKWGYRLVGRFLIQTPHLCLVNILAGKRAVPEFMPYYTSTSPIAAEALDLLANESRRQAMRRDLDAVVRSLGTASAAAQTARMALDMIAQSKSG